MKKTALACLVLAAIAATACSGKKSGAVSYEFTNVRRGTLERTISASGTLSPVSTVKVLPQMSGKVERIYVDYNDQVHKGDILAELNTDMLKLKRAQQYAAVVKARANYELQLVNYKNQEALAQKNLISEYDLKSSKNALDNQAADLAVAQANLDSIDTEINQFAYITSPIDGIVLDRKINIGDTVVDSSTSNSYIFMLAENLREMQIEAQIGELDITSIQKGQSVRFTLESLPGRTFSGVVETLRMVPVVSNNVVSYTVIVKVENAAGSLFSGMTCAVDFIVANSENTLMVSNAALRYQPTSLDAETIADMVFNASLENMTEEQRMAALGAREQPRAQNVSQTPNAAPSAGAGITNLITGGGGGGGGGGMPGPNFGGGPFPGGGGRQGQSQGQGQTRTAAPAVVMRNLWYFDDEGKLEVMQVQTGISSGSYTEIYGTPDLEGKQFILREKI